MTGSMNKKSNLNILLAILVILLPALWAGAIALFNFCKYGSGLSVPMWNDEAVYYALIKTWITPGAHNAFGNSIGYYGFNGGHAILGTGSGWSPAIIFPYAVFAKMFGLNYHTVWIANIIFMMMGNAIFLLIVKPDLSGKIKLLVTEAFAAPIILYISTQMSEPLRYALTLILAACIYKLFDDENKGKIFSYVIVPLYIICLVQIYVFFVFVVPIYIFAVLKDKKIWIRILTALVSTGITGGGSYALLHLISSNYNTYKAEKLFNAIGSGDITGMIRAAVGMVKEGVADWFNLFRYGANHGLLTWFTIVIFALFVIGIIGFLKAETSKDKALFLSASAGLFIFIGGFATMYSPDPNTFFRSISIVVLFAVFLIMMTDGKLLSRFALLVFAAGVLFVPLNIGDYTGEERVLSKEKAMEWDSLAGNFEKVLAIDTKASPWDSTLTVFTLEPKVLASVTPGIGINMMLTEDTIPTESGYLLFTKHEGNLRGDWLEKSFKDIYEKNKEIIDSDYTLVYEDNDYLIYKKNK